MRAKRSKICEKITFSKSRVEFIYLRLAKFKP